MSATLLGVFSAAEGTASVTTGSRTSQAGSLITAACGVWPGAGLGTTSAPTDSLTNTYTQATELGVHLDPISVSDGLISLYYNSGTGGARGGTHTLSKADDGQGNSIGGQEWAGVEGVPTVVHNEAHGSSTAPSAAVAVGAASLAILVFGYSGTATTFDVSDGTLAQEIDENSDAQAVGVHYKVGQTGTPSITATLAASREWGAAIVAFTEGAAPAGHVMSFGTGFGAQKGQRPAPFKP